MSLVCVLLIIGACAVGSKPVEEEYHLERVGEDYLYQGDMLLPKDILELALLGGDLDATTENSTHVTGVAQTSRSAASRLALKWIDGIVPYRLADSAKCNYKIMCWIFDRPELAIKSAIEEIEEKTCLKFVERTTEKDYLEFTNVGFGKCYSYVGRVGGKQEVSLSTGCGSHGIALHEIMHALGLHHEQSRPDRDDYVTINLNNVDSDRTINFRKYSFSVIKTYGAPYDYGSIMHYPSTAFGKYPWSKTITTKNDAEIGQRDHLSAIDIRTVNNVYKCPL